MASQNSFSDSAPNNEKRNYNNVSATISNHYKMMRQYQTVDFVKKMHSKYLKFEKPLFVWDALMKLNEWIDTSDPDISLPNVQHLFQAAEAARKAGKEDWFVLVALIHDLGKVLFTKGCEEDGTGQTQQFATVGDTFAVGCRLPDHLVFSEFNVLNPDMSDSRYCSELGMYTQRCGIENLLLSFGHDEYLYQVLKNHQKCCIPQVGLDMIRFHSFYAWHSVESSDYDKFMVEEDEMMKQSVIDFNKFDLYSKNNQVFDVEEMKKIYLPLIHKYLGDKEVLF